MCVYLSHAIYTKAILILATLTLAIHKRAFKLLTCLVAFLVMLLHHKEVVPSPETD